MLEAVGVLARGQPAAATLRPFPRPGAVFHPRRQGRPVGMGGRVLPGLADQPGAKYVNSPGNAAVRQEPAALRAGRGPRSDPQEPHGDGHGGLHRLHRRPPVRLRQRGGRAGHGLGRVPHSHPQAICRPHRAGARRRRGRPAAGQRSAGAVRRRAGRSADPHPARRDGPLRIPPASGAPRRFSELLDTRPSTPWSMPSRLHTGGSTWSATSTAPARPWSGCWRSSPRPRGTATTPPASDRLREEKILQRLAARFRIARGGGARSDSTALRRKAPAHARPPARRGAARRAGPGQRRRRGPSGSIPGERELLEVLVRYPQCWPAGPAAIAAEQIASPSCRKSTRRAVD